MCIMLFVEIGSTRVQGMPDDSIDLEIEKDLVERVAVV